MTSTVGTDPAQRHGTTGGTPVRPAGHAGVRTGQIVVSQVALVLVAAATGRGALLFAAATVAAVALLSATWVRIGGRWAYQWVGTALAYAGRRRALPADADVAALLDLAVPGARLTPAVLAGEPASVIDDPTGLTAVLEVGDRSGPQAEPLPDLPAPAALLPVAGPDTPPVRVQYLFSGVPAPRAADGIAAASYRQLTGGEVLGQLRVLLAVRVLRTEGWPEPELHRTLAGLVRKLPRRLGGVPVHPLGTTATLRLLAETAQHDGAPVGEGWRELRLGGLTQVVFQVADRPDGGLPGALLTLPATATTVAVAAGRAGPRATVQTDLTVRLAATSPAELAPAVRALHGRVAGARRLDGEQLPGLAATLPLGGDRAPGVPRPVPADASAATGVLCLPAGGAGLLLGRDRRGGPVAARLFRPEPTRVLLVGGVPAAQLVVLRAMALGARVIVCTARPQSWEPFVRGVSTPGETITLVPPGRGPDGPAGTPLHPVLVVADVGPLGAAPAGAGWQATLVVRDEFTRADGPLAARSDLLVLQPLRPDEAALAGAALGLGEAAGWLSRIQDDLVGVLNRRSVRWARLAATATEAQLVGPVARG